MAKKIRSLPTERAVIYPESDGKPMAETDIHRNLMIDTIRRLENHFKERDDVYVSGNLLLYYEKGNQYKSVAPDVFVVCGVEKKRRRTYFLWEEGKGPDFVLELASENTYRRDLGDKKDLYASVIKVKEYFLFDPDGRYLQPSLMGYRLTDGVYLPIQPVDWRLPSDVLGLELVEEAGELRLFDRLTNDWVLKPEEEEAEARRQAEEEAQQEFFARQQAEARAEQAEVKVQQEYFARQQAETKAQQEYLARQQAEDELAQLRALLEKLHATDE